MTDEEKKKAEEEAPKKKEKEKEKEQEEEEEEQEEKEEPEKEDFKPSGDDAFASLLDEFNELKTFVGFTGKGKKKDNSAELLKDKKDKEKPQPGFFTQLCKDFASFWGET